MPKFLPPDQVEALREKGVVFPGEAPPIPAETVAKALGNIGLPHSDSVERMDTGEVASGSIESIATPSFYESFKANYKTAESIMGLVGASIFRENDIDMTVQLTELKPVFDVFQARSLQPEVILTPTHRSLGFWENLYGAVTESPLNPNQATGNKKVLREGGLCVNNTVNYNWTTLVANELAPDWQLSVTSSMPRPKITNITGYGYTNSANQPAKLELNHLLKSLGQPEVPDRTTSEPLTQPNIHPTPEAYLMHQLTRVVQGKEPLDSTSFTWLNGTLPDGKAPAGYWSPDNRQVHLSWDFASHVLGDIGIRPSVRADHA